MAGCLGTYAAEVTHTRARPASTAAQGISDIKSAMTGYVIVRAESHEAAAKLFEQHPHFAIFPGESVEIMECLPMPPQ